MGVLLLIARANASSLGPFTVTLLRLIFGGFGGLLVFAFGVNASPDYLTAWAMLGGTVGLLIAIYFPKWLRKPEENDRSWLREHRGSVRRWSALLLLIVGSGIATMGFVESDGATAGLGVMLVVSGAFLGGWGRTLFR